jgi:two-component system response regulator PilR (NtrC family)
MGENADKAPVVLVVENNPQVLELLGDMVSAQGWEPVAVSTLKDALSSFAARTIDAIIADVELDDGNSIPLLLRAHERLPHPVPAFAISSYASESLRRDIKRLGAIDLLAKPFRIDDLARRLEKQLNPVPPTV